MCIHHRMHRCVVLAIHCGRPVPTPVSRIIVVKPSRAQHGVHEQRVLRVPLTPTTHRAAQKLGTQTSYGGAIRGSGDGGGSVDGA